VMLIEGFECIGLAHGITDDAVAAHAFFGTDRVVQELARMPGWADGRVELVAGSCVVRDARTNLVCGLRHATDLPLHGPVDVSTAAGAGVTCSGRCRVQSICVDVRS